MTANKKKVTLKEVTKVNSDSTVRDIPIIGDDLPENQIESNNSGVTGVTGVTASNDAACNGNPKKKAEVTGVTSLLNEAINPNEQPPISGAAVVDRGSIDRPCYAVYDEWFCFEDNKRKQPGVYYHGVKTTKEGDTIETDDYICDPLHVDAGSCDGSQNNFGLMLRFKNCPS